MKIGLHLSDYTWPGDSARFADTLRSIALGAEAAGFDSFWPMDHFFQVAVNGAPDLPVPESLSTLSFVAAITQRMRLGTLVCGVTHRHPGLLIKTVTTDGRHYRLQEPINSPPALQRPHPPILIGGSGERKTLNLMAQYADACNFFVDMGEERLRRKLSVLQQHCEAVGRHYEEIDRTCLDWLTISPDGRKGTFSEQKALDFFARLAEVGFDHAIIIMNNVFEPGAFEVFAERIVPAVHGLEVAGRHFDAASPRLEQP